MLSSDGSSDVCSSVLVAAALCGHDQPHPRDQHRDGQLLPHGQPPRQCAELDVGFAHELEAEAAEAIEDRGEAEEETRLISRVGAPEEKGEDREHENALQPRLVELARVARQVAGARERSEERSVGKECVSTCSFGWWRSK